MGKLSTKGKKNSTKDSKQPKITSFLKKDSLSSLCFEVEWISPEKPKFESNHHDDLSKECSSLTPLSSNDSDIIEGTPEASSKLNFADNKIKAFLIDSPDVVPPTPEFSGKKSTKTDGIIYKKKKSVHLTDCQKENDSSSISSVKRLAECRTGVSPNAKRVANDASCSFSPESKSKCKYNLSECLENASKNDSVDGSFSILQTGLKKLTFANNQAKLLSRNNKDNEKSLIGSLDEQFDTLGQKKAKLISYEGNLEASSALTDLKIVTLNQGNSGKALIEAEKATSENLERKFGPFQDGILGITELIPSESENSKVLHSGKAKSSSNAKNASNPILSPSSLSIKENYGRHEVLSVERDSSIGELNLELRSLSDGQHKTCSLSGFWFESNVNEKDTVHILSTNEVNGHYTISDKKGIIVINPDFLISGTSVVSGVFCRRKTVLNEKFKGYDSGNKVMIIGTLVHQLFQEVILMSEITEESLERIVYQLMQHKRILQDLYRLDITIDEIKEDILAFIPFILKWSNKYLNGRKENDPDPQLSSWNGCISSILDIEENVWSPKYGIKGKIDLTVETKNEGSSKVMPLELKTGRSSFSAEHKGQVVLYSMMTSDRREDPKAGLLLYLKDGAMAEIPALEKEKKGLIQLRNELASYLYVKKCSSGNKTESVLPLPEPLERNRVCAKCPQLLPCSSFLGIEQTPSITERHSLFQHSLSHLSENHLEYFRKWCLMLQCESSHSSGTTTNDALWCLDPKQRENSGDCLAEVVLQQSSTPKEVEPGYFLHSFCRSPNSNSSKLPENFQVGDNVAVSSDREIAISQGSVVSYNHSSIEILLDRNLRSFHSKWKRKIYRIDRITTHATMGTNYMNLALLLENSPRAEKLRHLIIDKEKPQFAEGISRLEVEKLRPILKRMNQQQRKAVTRAIRTKDFSILKGFPGTGKTSTIANMVHILSKLNKSILLTSNTHSAVDNILLKLKDIPDLKVLRLGRLSRINKDLHSISEENITRNVKSVQELSSIYNNTNVVAATCLGLNHPVFKKRTFDYCIMDEASQCLQPTSIGPLLYCNHFILVGDALQLPPVVHSSTAKSLGMSKSMLEYLDVEEATVSLFEQYRMNGPIMEVANKLMYEGQLKCSSEELETRTIDLPLYKAVKRKDHSTFLARILSDKLEDAVLFLDTGGSFPESKNSSKLSINLGEAKLINQILDVLLKYGFPPGEVGIITPFRAQVKLLKSRLPSDLIEVNTVDQYQGRDKEIILYSCVRSDRSQNFKVGANEILMDLRRLNVATTRAKYKLVIIGDKITLENFGPFEKLFHILSKEQIYRVEVT